MKQAIAYYRVSTRRQGRSGLGLEAQQVAVASYCQLNGYKLVDEVVEVKSTRKQQYGLFEAMERCRFNKATLMVARLDRLGRDVEKIARLVKSDVDIVVTDNPQANRFTIHIIAAVDEEQRQRISETTKAALAAARKRGVILGKQGKIQAVRNKKAADDFAHQLLPRLNALKKQGISTVRAIAQALNNQGIPTFRGDSQWHPSTICELQKRLKPKQPTTMKTRPVMIASNENAILFDDRSLLEAAFGKKALLSTAPKTDCDCISHASTLDDEDVCTDQIATIVG